MAGRIVSLLLLLAFAGLFINVTAQEKKEIEVKKKTEIVTVSSEKIHTNHIIISSEQIAYRTITGDTQNINYDNIKYIYIKERSVTGKLFLYCISFGVGYGLVYGIIYPDEFGQWMAAGIIGGALAGLILMPFFKSPPTLVYYNGKWVNKKYSPD